MLHKVTVNFVIRDGQKFYKIFKIFCGHKSETMRHMGLKICMDDKTHRYYKYTKFN